MEKYPDIPVLSNYLIAAYRLSGQGEKTTSVLLESYKKHPDYLFAKINYALYCIQKGDPHKVPEIFDNKLELKLLYPHREKFHISEFMNFMGVMALYRDAIGEPDIAERYYKMMKQVDRSHDMVRVVKNNLYPSLSTRLLKKIIKILPKGKV